MPSGNKSVDNGREASDVTENSWWGLGLQNEKKWRWRQGQLVIMEDFTVVQYLYVQNVYSL